MTMWDLHPIPGTLTQSPSLPAATVDLFPPRYFSTTDSPRFTLEGLRWDEKQPAVKALVRRWTVTKNED